jgi:hypothetical protein
MLSDALRLIAAGEAGSSEQLARKLGVELPLARQLLEELVRLGYLRPTANSCCQAKCAGCPSAGSCLSLPQMWFLTDKGKRALGTAVPGRA